MAHWAPWVVSLSLENRFQAFKRRIVPRLQRFLSLMKVRSALKLMCPHCFFVRRRKKLYVMCKRVPKHKQRQGFSTAAIPDAQHLLGSTNTTQMSLSHHALEPIVPLQPQYLSFLPLRIGDLAMFRSAAPSSRSSYLPSVSISGDGLRLPHSFATALDCLKI